MTTRLARPKMLRCPQHGRVAADRRRISHSVVDGDDTMTVDDVAAWVCPVCATVLAIPHGATGRIAAALQRRSSGAVQELRVPLDLEDLALGVNATLGTAGLGDAFTLPVHLGLQLVGDREAPLPSWQRFDAHKKEGRARPRLHPDIRARLEGLASLWQTDLSTVIRWLSVLAADAILAGLTTTASRVEDAAYGESSSSPSSSASTRPSCR